VNSERVIADIAVRLNEARTATEACQAVVSVTRRHTPAMVAVLLQVRDRLRCTAATGSWQVYSSIPPNAGVAGRAFTSGKTEVITDAAADPDYIPLGPDIDAEICAPILDTAGRPVGVLNVEWTEPVDVDVWRDIVEAIATRLGERLTEVGGAAAESRSEKLLRYAGALTSAPTIRELFTTSVDAARDVSGLATALLIMQPPDGVRVCVAPGVPTRFESRLRAHLGAASTAELDRLATRARRHGTSYTLGDPDHLNAHGLEELVEAGVRSMIAVPVGPDHDGGVLLVLDEGVVAPDPTTVNLIELLAAQAWTCLDRLRTLKQLHRQATSDPLTGLRHHGSFGERIAAATPGRTALLAIDVDQFKSINDMYGHQVGDRVLVNLARALESALRHGDELYRIGGDEFVAVVDVLRPEEAVGIGRRLADAAREIGRTVSVGVAVRRFGESPELTLRRADAALYDVKRDGRDGVRAA
jgi:diguanylate cyclase (GGDEF)-like protein